MSDCEPSAVWIDWRKVSGKSTTAASFITNIIAGRTHGWYKVNLSFWFASPRQEDGSILPAQDWQKNSANNQPILLGQHHICTEHFCCLFHRYQTLAVATDANTKEDIGNKKVSGKKLTVSLREMQKLHIYLYIITSKWCQVFCVVLPSVSFLTNLCNVSQKLRICSKPPHTISYFLLNFYRVNLPSCSIYWHKLWYFLTF